MKEINFRQVDLTQENKHSGPLRLLQNPVYLRFAGDLFPQPGCGSFSDDRYLEIAAESNERLSEEFSRARCVENMYL